MAKSNNQKGKILYLERILQNSGEDHAVSMQEILETLAEKGITAERKSIYDDMAVLREFGMDIRYRRGKPGGYYLAGWPAGGQAALRSEMEPETGTEAVPEPVTRPETEPGAAPESVTRLEAEPEAVPEGASQTPSWLGRDEDSRQIKLTCENSVRSRVEEIFGESGSYKEKGMMMFTVTAEISETPEFYGWLVSMGRHVYIQKPRKTAAAYRDYLKELAREYKGV